MMEHEMDPVETREEFARSFVRSFRQAQKLIEKKASGEQLPPDDFEEWINRLKAEAEQLKVEHKNAD